MQVLLHNSKNVRRVDLGNVVSKGLSCWNRQVSEYRTCEDGLLWSRKYWIVARLEVGSGVVHGLSRGGRMTIAALNCQR